MKDLFDLLRMESDEIASGFGKASLEGRGTSQEVGDRRREAVLTKFLHRFFPFPYKIAKGNISDSFGGRSASIDCLLLNPSHPHTVTDSRYSIIFADGVDAAIELKPSLASMPEIVRGIEQLRTVKQLTRVKTGLVKPFATQTQIETATKIPAFLFTNETYQDVGMLLSKIVDYYVDNQVPRTEQFDFIIVNRRCVIANATKDSYAQMKNVDEGLVVLETGLDSLASFLYWLNLLPQTEVRMSKPLLSHYLPWKVSTATRFDALFARLATIKES